MKKMENANATDKYVESKSIRNTTLDSVDYDSVPYKRYGLDDRPSGELL